MIQSYSSALITSAAGLPDISKAALVFSWENIRISCSLVFGSTVSALSSSRLAFEPLIPLLLSHICWNPFEDGPRSNMIHSDEKSSCLEPPHMLLHHSHLFPEHRSQSDDQRSLSKHLTRFPGHLGIKEEDHFQMNENPKSSPIPAAANATSDINGNRSKDHAEWKPYNLQAFETLHQK